MKDYLKVKITSLAAEAKIIRQFENRRLKKASYARAVTDLAKVIARHRRVIERLAIAGTTRADHEDRILWHKAEIDRLKRQSNKTSVTPHTVEYNEQVYHGLRNHRVQDVRRESRSAVLALAFLKNRKYENVEQNVKHPPNTYKVAQLVRKYGEGRHGYDFDVIYKKVKEWAGESGNTV